MQGFHISTVLKTEDNVPSNMKKNPLKPAAISLIACCFASLLLAGCTTDDAINELPNNVSYGDFVKLTTGKFEAQWLANRTVIGTTTLTSLADSSLLIQSLPAKWLTDQLLAEHAQSAISNSSAATLLSYDPVGYSSQNSYVSMANTQQAQTDSINGILLVKPYGELFTLFFEFFTIESFRPTQEQLDASSDSIFTYNEYYLNYLHLNQQQSVGMFSQADDAWTLKFQADSLTTIHCREMVKWYSLDDRGHASRITVVCDTIGQRFASPLSLSLITTRRQK